MRSFVIRTLLPYLFCAVPLLAAGLVVVSVPPGSRMFYWDKMTNLDVFIVGLGVSIFAVQVYMARYALRWETATFNETFDRSLSNLGQSAEWFPLLGLIGTVAAIMQTFASFGDRNYVPQGEIITKFAPAITATLSGLFMALLNILPTWMVLVGRQIILKLGGDMTAGYVSSDRRLSGEETRIPTVPAPQPGQGQQP